MNSVAQAKFRNRAKIRNLRNFSLPTATPVKIENKKL